LIHRNLPVAASTAKMASLVFVTGKSSSLLPVVTYRVMVSSSNVWMLQTLAPVAPFGGVPR
jgi:hypothetical protein